MGLQIPRWLAAMLVTVFAGSIGCNAPDQTEACGDVGDLSKLPAENPADWRKLPREELARRGDAVLNEIRSRDTARRQGNLRFSLLPRSPLLFLPPAFYELQYDAKRQFSLPPYAPLEPGSTDTTLAWQFARFGDNEAAMQLCDPRQLSLLDNLRSPAAYPIEWTRLVALEMHSLLQQIATGDKEALDRFLAFRSQVEAAFDVETPSKWLERTLLCRGRSTLRQAAAAWRHRGDAAQAEKADAALEQFPSAPESTGWPAAMEYCESLCQVSADGRIIFCDPASRVLDLLQIPLPREAVDAVVLFFSRDRQLQEIWVGYAPRASQEFVRAADLAAGLCDWGNLGVSAAEYCALEWCGVSVEVRLLPANAAVGAWVRFRVRPQAADADLPRTFGDLSLDRSFVTNRLRIAPQDLGQPLIVRKSDLLERTKNPLPAGVLDSITLHPSFGGTCVQEFSFQYKPSVSLFKLARPLFARLGPALFSEHSAAETSAFPMAALEWRDAHTELRLEAFHEQRRPTAFRVRDRGEFFALGLRTIAVLAAEENERQERVRNGRPNVRLGRKLEQLPLGIERRTALQYLPQGPRVYRRELANGLLVVNNAAPADDQPYIIRQLILRFDEHDRLCWVQGRLEGNPRSKDATWPAALLLSLTAAGGAVEPLASPYDLRMPRPPAAAAPTCYRWSDDLTEASYLLDGTGVEITLSSRSAGLQTPLAYLPAGPDGDNRLIRLGATRSELEEKLGAKLTAGAEGEWILPGAGGHDVVLVWYRNDRVCRIAARFVAGSPPKTAPKDMEKQLLDQWGAHLKMVGWPQRREYVGDVLRSLLWFDDSVRFRLFWLETDNSPPRLWAEWSAE